MIYLEIFWVFSRVSVISFGGVFGVLPELERLVVQKWHWISAEQFVQSYVIGQFVPGPNMSMCSLIGYRVAGPLGAVAAILGIYSGPVAIVGVGCGLYYRNREKEWVRRAELALRPLVFALIFSSSAIFLLQQIRTRWGVTALIAVPIAWLDWNRKLGTLSCVFLAGFLWWLLVYAPGYAGFRF